MGFENWSGEIEESEWKPEEKKKPKEESNEISRLKDQISRINDPQHPESLLLQSRVRELERDKEYQKVWF